MCPGCQLSEMNYSLNFVMKTVFPAIVATIGSIVFRRRLSWLLRAAIVIVTILLLTTTQKASRLSATYESQHVPAGGGWSFFLNKQALRGRPVYAKSGLQTSGRWGAGTKIKDLQAALVRDGLTLSSYPSVQNGTLGGWIASGSHGSGGTLWKSNFGDIVVRDLRSGHEFTTRPKALFHRRARIDECRRYLILEVQVTPHANVWCKKLARKMATADTRRCARACETAPSDVS